MEKEKVKKFLVSKDIFVTDNKFYFDKSIFANECYIDFIINQINLINYVHKILMNNNCIDMMRIQSIVGRRVEKFKVNIKKLEHNLLNLNVNNCMDEFIKNRGSTILNQAKFAINSIDKEGYLKILKRTMKKNEICLGNVDESNIRIMERVEIGSIDKLAFNLVEEDIYDYIRNVRKNNIYIDIEKIIDYYIQISKLDIDSKKYIKNLLCFPYDCVSIWRKYIKNSNKYDCSYYLHKICKSFNYEIKNKGELDYE